MNFSRVIWSDTKILLWVGESFWLYDVYFFIDLLDFPVCMLSFRDFLWLGCEIYGSLTLFFFNFSYKALIFWLASFFIIAYSRFMLSDSVSCFKFVQDIDYPIVWLIFGFLFYLFYLVANYVSILISYRTFINYFLIFYAFVWLPVVIILVFLIKMLYPYLLVFMIVCFLYYLIGDIYLEIVNGSESLLMMCSHIEGPPLLFNENWSLGCFRWPHP